MNKEEFRIKAKNQIDELIDKIDYLEGKKDSLSSKIRNEYQEQIDLLKNKKIELTEKYDQLTTTAENNWDNAKESFVAASDSVKNGLEELTSIFA